MKFQTLKYRNMCIVKTLQAKPARGRCRKFPAARNVTSFAYRRASEASHFLNSVVLFNCGHHFSAPRSSSQVSALFNSSHNSSQLFSTLLTFAYSTFLSSTLLTSSQLFSTLLATSHLLSTLVDNVHLCPPHINSCQLAELFSPLLNSCENRHLCWTHFNCQLFQL